jgi:hypothetical protein
MSMFPENTVSKYITKLPSTLEFHGNWEVGLAEIIFPMTFYNVRIGKCKLDFFYKTTDVDFSKPELIKNSDYYLKKLFTITVPEGNYKSLNDVLEYINSHEKNNDDFILFFDQLSSRIGVKSNLKYSVFCNKEFGEILGFNRRQPMEGTSPLPASLYKNMPQQLFVYSDIVEPQIVGDTVAPLLRIIGVQPSETFGSVIEKNYETPHYLPLLKRQFETIDISICDHTGKPAAFEYGPVTIKLHFKRNGL